MGQSVKKFIKVIVLLAIILALLGAAFVLDTVNDAGDRLKRSLAVKASTDKARTLSDEKKWEELEADSSFKREDLESYLPFSYSIRNSSDYIAELLDEGKIAPLNKTYYTTAHDIKLAPLLKNHCNIAYCYQHRMPFSDIPSLFWKGLMGIEDYRFLEHIGVDFISILRAIVADLKAMKLVQGGSTLTQQLVKNLYFNNKKTFTRKIKEMIIAIYIDSKYEKEEILESYFNEVFWGSYNGLRIKGIFSASLVYFNKKPKDISAYEVAILIGMLKGPNYYSPLTHLDRIKSRSKVVFKKLRTMGLFSTKNSKEWNDKDFMNWTKLLKNKKRRLALESLWRVSQNNSLKPFMDFERYVFILNAKALEFKLKKKYKNKDITVKALIKKASAKVTQEYNESSFEYYSKYERDQNLAITKEKHQIGSTLKPILYYLFQQNNYSLDDYVSTKKITLKLKSGKWSPREAHNPKKDEITLLEALLESLNRPVIHISKQIGFQKIEEDLSPYLKGLKTPLSEYPSQLLGSIELSLKELWDAYYLFIKESCKVDQDFENTLIYKISDPRLTTIRNVVYSNLKDLRLFGKTGTSNNGYDNWYVFFDGNNLGIVWTGVEGKRDLEKLKLYGSTTSFPIYQNYLLGRGKQVNELNCFNFDKDRPRK